MQPSRGAIRGRLFYAWGEGRPEKTGFWVEVNLNGEKISQSKAEENLPGDKGRGHQRGLNYNTGIPGDKRPVRGVSPRLKMV